MDYIYSYIVSQSYATNIHNRTIGMITPVATRGNCHHYLICQIELLDRLSPGSAAAGTAAGEGHSATAAQISCTVAFTLATCSVVFEFIIDSC